MSLFMYVPLFGHGGLVIFVPPCLAVNNVMNNYFCFWSFNYFVALQVPSHTGSSAAHGEARKLARNVYKWLSKFGIIFIKPQSGKLSRKTCRYAMLLKSQVPEPQTVCQHIRDLYMSEDAVVKVHGGLVNDIHLSHNEYSPDSCWMVSVKVVKNRAYPSVT